MKALVLAAGRGTRLSPLTDALPKPMVPFAGKPLLEYVVRLLARHGFDDLVINLHHLPHVIADHFGAGRAWGVSITYSHEDYLLGTAGAARQVADFFDGPFLVYYGDNLTNFDLSDLWQTHQRAGALATIGLVRLDDPTTRGIVGLDAHHLIDRFIEKPRPDQVFDNYWVNAGIYALQPEILDRIPPDTPCDFSEVFADLLAAGRSLRGHPLRGQILATDTPERYRHARQRVDSAAFTLP